MILQDWISKIDLKEGQKLMNQDKVSNFIYWDVIRNFEGSRFAGLNYWNGKPVVQWVVVQYKNRKWKAIAYYVGSVDNQIYFLVKSDPYQSRWIISQSLDVLREIEHGTTTLRGLHYKMVGRGMINSMTHYKRVVTSMIECRRNGKVPYEMFADHDRPMTRLTEWKSDTYQQQVRTAKRQIELWIDSYSLKRWDRQPYYPEVWVEKKALIGVFEKPCNRHRVAFAACKGYPSLTFLSDAAIRFRSAEEEGRRPILLYFGDYDPSGEDIPRSIQVNLFNDFGLEVIVKRVALTEDQVVEWGLPPAPVKPGDSRSAQWDGLGQVELDAADDKIPELIDEEIDLIFDETIFESLRVEESIDRLKFKKELQIHVQAMEFEDQDEDQDD